MKKNILAIAIASAVATPVAFANAPTVYGQFNLAIDNYDSVNEVVHRNSRLGVKGSEDLGNGLKAVYQMEGTISMGDFAANRNTFAGLAGGFGTVVMGRHDTPLRMIQPNDGFADSAAAGNNTSRFGGLSSSTANALTGHNHSGEDRLNNVLAYISPSFSGIQLAVATATDNTGATALIEKKIAEITSLSVAYGSKSKGIYVAAAMTDVAGYRGNTRVTAQYNEAGLTASVMYNATAADSTNTLGVTEGNSITGYVSYKMGAMTPRAKVAMISYDTVVAGEDSAMNMAVGVDYALAKSTKVYAEFAQINANTRGAGAYADQSVMSVGLLHKF